MRINQVFKIAFFVYPKELAFAYKEPQPSSLLSVKGDAIEGKEVHKDPVVNFQVQ